MKGKLLSILRLKCPRCRKGKLLVGHPYNLNYFNKVNESCPRCKVHFKIEPSFFYGSMYVSYGLGVGMSVALYVLQLLLGLNLNMIQNFILICVSLIILMPYINALSKVLWAGFFIPYDAEAEKNSNSK